MDLNFTFFIKTQGLDPAGPGFSEAEAGAMHNAMRLSKRHAKFVDVIHCNTRLLGNAAIMGDATFFPNGGRFQPGCENFLGICELNFPNGFKNKIFC